MRKEITIGEQVIPFEANAWTPFLYKKEFGRDVTADVTHIKTESGIDTIILSQLAYVMAKGANPELEPMEEWLKQFGMFDILGVQNEIIELWGINNQQSSKPRKK